MEDILTRFIENLLARVSGPMRLRLILQPLMAIVFAIRDGLKDAQEGRPAYFWEIFSNPDRWRKIFREGWKSVGKIFIIAIIIDFIYQVIILQWFYPVEAVFVAAILAFLPYLLIRAPVNWIATRKQKNHGG
jgi:TRAP-type C4-dicarboxylate transport system permease large subunit